jgi:hypothetical protein
MTKDQYEKAKHLYLRLESIDRYIDRWNSAMMSEFGGVTIKTISSDAPVMMTEKEFNKFKAAQIKKHQEVKAQIEEELAKL